jgi:phospholipid/cholesterol/gamma-HCH transport system ATP-binding protein
MKIESLKFDGVTFGHDGQEPILYNADFDFPLNEIVWVNSEVGAGKSSLLQLLGGLQMPQSGNYYINGNNVAEMSFEEFLPFRLEIGYAFDYGGLISNRTLFDNLMLPLVYHKILNSEEAKERVMKVMGDFGLSKLADQRPAHVSGRVRKLVCLIRTLIMKPQILLLDDPSVGLEQESLDIFIDYLNLLKDEGFLNHVFVSSYDNKFMNMFAYTIINLSEGQIYKHPSDPEKRVVAL